MRQLVYFHIDEVARDAVVAANLRQILKNHGVELVYGNRADTRLFGLFDNFSAFDLYVFPSLDLFQANCPDPNRVPAPIILLPTETVGGTSRNIHRVAAKYFGSFTDESWPWINVIAAFCVWGPSHLKAFQTKGPHLLPKCHVVGHPRFDKRCQLQRSPTDRSGKICVGIISRGVATNPFDGRTLLQVVYEGRKIPGHEHPIYHLSPDRDVEDRIYTEIVDLRLIYELIERLDPKQYEVIVRAHPRENRKSWESLISHNKFPIKMAPWDEPYMHWLKSMDYIVGPVSTSLYDCMVAWKKPICTVDIVPHRQSHVLAGGDDENPILNFVLRPKSIQELMQMVSVKPQSGSLELPSGLLDVLHQESNYPDCVSSLDRLAGVCLDVLRATPRAHRSRFHARLKHKVFAAGQAIATQIRNHNKPEQSATFVLNNQRKRWIDGLAFSGRSR